MSHQLTKRVRVGDLPAEERAQRGLTAVRDDEIVNIAIANVVKDPPIEDETRPVKLQPGERIEEIK